ncbi:MAG: glycosyl transferase family protein [Pseudomonadota bacterium]
MLGCYGNDPQTIAAAIGAATVLVQQGDNRLRIVIHDHQGPSTKADCLNRLYRALLDDERRSKGRFTCVVFHDAEDMVDPAGLSLLDQEIAAGADFVQLPVEPLVQKSSRWLGSHYCEEFAEAHAKSMVVRSWLGAPLPGAGVGCAISRRALHQLSREHPDGAPFDAQSLTEDYELGLLVAERGGTSRFARAFGEDGSLVATRAYFPSRLDHVVRQKTRWVHGIALQGWDRLGWTRTFADTWMRARDRRGPFAAFVLLMGYALFAVTLILWLGAAFGVAPILALTPALKALVAINLAALFWRSAFRFGFTAQAYGFVEGLRAVLRIPVSNVVSIMAGHRAIKAYAATLLGASIVWDKTPHFRHPANAKALLPPFRRESRSKLTRAEG